MTLLITVCVWDAAYCVGLCIACYLDMKEMME